MVGSRGRRNKRADFTKNADLPEEIGAWYGNEEDY